MPDLKVLKIFEQKVQPRGDLEMELNSNGTFHVGPTMISDTDKIVQDVMKGVLTRLGSNFLAPSFGTTIPSLLHTRKLEQVSNQIVAEIQTLLGYLGRFNINEPLAEQITQLISLKAKESDDTIEIDMRLETGGGQIVGVSI